MRTFSLPDLKGNAGKVLTVSSDEENVEWDVGGGSVPGHPSVSLGSTGIP